MIQFQQSESTAERRRWILVLVDASDGVTGLTGQTGTVFVSKNGAAGVASTNSIVEVDSGDMPGHYYIELTAAELDTLGWVSISKKTAASLAFHDRAIVSYNDPYQSVGGFAGGGSSTSQLTKQQLDYIVEQVWKYKFSEEVTAQDALEKAANHPLVDLSGLEDGINSIAIPETDLSPVLDRLDNLVIPQPIDYTLKLNEIQSTVESFKDIGMDEFKDSLGKFASQMSVTAKEIDLSLETVGAVKDGFNDLKILTDEFIKKISEMPDVDDRFRETINSNLSELLTAITNVKYDILEELNKE